MTELQAENNNNQEVDSAAEAAQSPQIATKGKRLAANVRKKLLHADTPEFQERCNGILEAIYAKYAWVAQQQGFVLRQSFKTAALEGLYLRSHCEVRIRFPPYREEWSDKTVATRCW
jgi:hypothetical protein